MRSVLCSTAVLTVLVLALAACGGGGAGDGGGDDDDVGDIDAAAGPVDAPGTTPDGGGGGGPDGGGGNAADPGQPGRYMVHTQDNVSISVGTSTTVRGTVYSPSDNGTSPAAGPFPLVIVSSGFQLARTQYALFCQHLATWGYVCITHDYASSGSHQDKGREVSKIIDWATSAPSGLAGRVDAARIGVAGHSLGGKVSIQAAIFDTRIKAVVGWDPVDALPPIGGDGSMSVTPEMMGNLRVPLAVLGQTTDTACAPTADNFQAYFTRACSAPATLEVTVGMSDHMDWIGDKASCGLACFACRSGQTPEATVHAMTKRVTVGWFERHLRGVVGMDMWMTQQALGAPATVRTATGC